MKLPKGLGNMGGLLKQAQEAMARAQNLEKELALEEIGIDRAGVKAKFSGTGELLSLKLDPSLVDPGDLTSLEDSILLVIREGLARAGDLRKEKLAEITGGLPMPPGMNPF